MRSFEQQTADAIRNLTVAVTIIGIAVLLVCALATWGLLSARSDATKLAVQQGELKKSVQSPTHGKDIAIWCGFDTSIEADLLAYVGNLHAPALSLPSLNCAQIEAGEAASTKTRH